MGKDRVRGEGASENREMGGKREQGASGSRGMGGEGGEGGIERVRQG